MWKVLKQQANKNIDTFYFKEVAKRNREGYVTEFNDLKNTKVQINRNLNYFYFEENKEEFTWKIISEIENNHEFNLKQFTAVTEFGTIKKITIFNNAKMTIRNESLEDGVKHIYGKPGSLYEEHCELLGQLG